MEKFLRFSLLFFFSFVFLSSLSLGDEMGQEKEGERIGTVLPLAFFVLCFSSFFLLRILHEKNEDNSFSEIHNLQMIPLSWKPRVFSIPNLLTSEECDYLIEYAKDRLERSTVVSQTGQTGPQVDSGRSSSGTWVPSRPKVVQRLEERIAAVSHLPVFHGESLYILKYKEGEQYHPHYDWFEEESMEEMATIGGQRIITILIYLQTPEQGGETAFPEINLTVPPLKGSAILFYNLDLDAQRDLYSLHSSIPVGKGEKWAAVKWLREFDGDYGRDEWFW